LRLIKPHLSKAHLAESASAMHTKSHLGFYLHNLLVHYFFCLVGFYGQLYLESKGMQATEFGAIVL
jgi:hypothetical protein